MHEAKVTIAIAGTVESVVTDDEGRFTIHRSPVQADKIVRAEKYHLSGTTPIRNDDCGPYRIVLSAGSALKMRIVDGDTKRPIGGAVVMIDATNGSGISDRDGKLEIRGLDADSVGVMIRADNYENRFIFRLIGNSTDVSLFQGKLMSGTVVSSSGAAVEGASVHIYNTKTKTEVADVLTDGLGRWRANLVANGRHLFRATATGYGKARIELEVSDTNREGLVLRLEE